MRITKYVHSCILIEHDEKTVLIDPGQFSWESGLFNPTDFNNIDEIVITHEHFDHCSLEFIQAVISVFPKVKIVTNNGVKKKLQSNGIVDNITTNSTDLTVLIPLMHDSMDPLSSDPPAENVSAHVLGLVSHPGDSVHLSESRNILCMPLAGPWGSAIEAIRMASNLGPHAVIPIHDWMWNQDWRKTMYDRMEVFFRSRGIVFFKPEDGQSFEVNV